MADAKTGAPQIIEPPETIRSKIEFEELIFDLKLGFHARNPQASGLSRLKSWIEVF
jgi:hypothetical protein